MILAAIENIKGGINPECGCYEETCDIWPCEVTLHLEDDGTGDVFFDFGDYEIDENFPAKTMEELRMFQHVFLKHDIKCTKFPTKKSIKIIK